MLNHINHSAPYSVARIVEILARTRRRKKLTQASLGAMLRLPQGHISNIERGKTDLRLSTLLEMAHLLDLEVMLVPRNLVPAVRAIMSDGPGAESAEISDGDYLYRLGR